MDILVINGDCVQTNTSANLCHLAYIQGLVDCGHQVTLLSADGRDYALDPSMNIPSTVKHYTYYGMSIYEKLSMRKNRATVMTPIGQNATYENNSAKKRCLRKLVSVGKSFALSLYGVHGIYATFVRKAQQFSSSVEYDYVLSISTPVSSHLLAHKLITSGKVKTRHWIQVWEDPWYSDAYGFCGDNKTYREEKRLLNFAEKVCYVSPLTLDNQKRIYSESAHKMYWQPLPFYYKAEAVNTLSFAQNSYGYFGDYAPAARNLEPFYEAAKETGIEVNICGNPCNLFASTENIHIHPRLPLDKLKPIEDGTNVLVFLCNRRGGQIPGKIYQYSATNKTILFIMDGTLEEQAVLKDYFGQFNRYVFCQNTKEDIAQAIQQIESGNLGSVINEPLENFDPTITIRNILNAGS